MDQKTLDELKNARLSRTDTARPDIVSRLKGSGKLTARQRLEQLMDAGSEVYYGGIAAAQPAPADSSSGPWIAETGGFDAVCSIDGQAAIVSTTDYSDRGGGYGAARMGRLFALAIEHRWPVVLFVDGGGSRARHPRQGLGHIELSGAIGPFTVFDGMADLSGWVPTISIVSGPSFAGHASIAGFSDIVIATRGSAIGMGGPPMVEAALGKRLTPQELSSAEMQAANGGIEALVENEAEAIALAKRCLAYWRERTDTDLPPDGAQIADCVPDEGGYDMHSVITALVDVGSLTELRAAFAGAIITAFARIGGRSIGLIASNPAVDGGVIDELAAQKILRQVELCDAWGLPIVALIDTPGTETRWVARDGSITRTPGHSRLHLRPLLAHQTRTVPLLSVQLRRGGGIAPALMTGFSTGASVAPLAVAWPTVHLNDANGFAMVRDANAFDDIIDPAATRPMLQRLLKHIPLRESRPSRKKRPVDSW